MSDSAKAGLKGGESRAAAHFRPLFSYEQLPEHLAEVSRPFGQLLEMILTLPEGPEMTTACRKLLEAKDCAVRARVLEAT